MKFNPCVSSKNITEFYKRYILTTFKMDKKGYDGYNKQLENALNQEGEIAKGPYLNISSPYKKGHTPKELAEQGVLNKTTANIFPDRKLYIHQEEALKKIKDGKNIIISTGTGSGKTESFLLPIIDELATEQSAGTLTGGVRAIIIYPMNALANDQIDGMEELLKNTKFTFGKYTGETEETESKAQEEYRKCHNGNTAPENEILSRERMRETPPHILITNYAMLEYLLLRPEDNQIFTGNSSAWKYMVFDEAHSYNGAKAIEVACLIKRVKAMLRRDDIQFILTSATLGDPENDAQKIADFASNLCNAKFDKDDIITATAVELEKPQESFNVDSHFYTELAECGDEQQQLQKLKEHMPDLQTTTLAQALFDFISKDKFYYEFREVLKNGPKTTSELANKLSLTEDEIINFIFIASQACKNDTSLFDAKYHMFIKGIDGVFITLKPSYKLFIKKMATYKANPEDENDMGERVFQVSFCANCNALYIIGKEENGKLEQPSDFETKPEVFLLSGLLDDDTELDERQGKYNLCGKCGSITIANEPLRCNCGKEYINEIIKVSSDKEVHTCNCCHHINTQRSITRPYLLGNEAATAVISSALYNELPGQKVEVRQEVIDDPIFGIQETRMQTNTTLLPKQFLTFSDSRQNAAFFSPYLSKTYNDNLVKTIITKIVNENRNAFKNGITLKRLSEFLWDKFRQYNLFSEDMLKEAWIYILIELSNYKAKNSLEKKGILKFELDLDNINIPDSIPFGGKTFSKEEIKTLCNILVRNMIKESAFNTAITDITFTEDDIERITGLTGYENFKQYGKQGTSDNQVSYWLPEEGRQNIRLKFLCKLFNEDIKNCPNSRELLEKLWNLLTHNDIRIIIQSGNYYGLNLAKIKVKTADKLYFCPHCYNIVPFNLKGLCAYSKCSSQEAVLQDYDYETVLKDDHYYKMYHTYNIAPMRVEEHTAQLASEKASQYQNDFKDKRINVLSCSTTFELGVNVGDLQTVLMRDMPPTPANYAQRAGRAGRSKEAAAYALTFCQNTSHDLNYFADPTPMIIGKIQPPVFDINNDKIVLRHIFASAFSLFWREQKDKYQKQISAFFENNGFDAMQNYLQRQPAELKEYLLKTVPQNLQVFFGIQDFKWVKKLFNNCDNAEETGCFDIAKARYEEDIRTLEEEVQTRNAQRRPVDYLNRCIDTIKNQPVISFLSKNNLIPKYGFPVDTVDLQTGYNATNDLRLSRDLLYAISEYAPGSEVVADGKLYKSQYIKKIAKYAWPTYKYKICTDCHTLNRVIFGGNIDKCSQCGKELSYPGEYIIPKFGFQISDKVKKVGLNKPEKTYRGEVHYIGNGKQSDIKKDYKICGHDVHIESSSRDTLVVLNQSRFYVCNTCGYAIISEDDKTSIVDDKEHEFPNGKPCVNQTLTRYSLGHEFLTDVAALTFPDIDTSDIDKARTVLYSLIEGFSRSMNIDRRELSGCLQICQNNKSYKFIIFDNTPGGAGYVKQLTKEDVLKRTLREGFRVVETCTCGGDMADTVCYNCLCNYYNQKYHDSLKRKYAIEFYRKFAQTYSDIQF